MNIAKLDWFWSGGTSYDSDYQTILSRASALGYTQPSDSLKTKQSQLVTDLKGYGVWTLIDVLYVFKNNDSNLGNFSLLNWKTPASFECTLPVAPTYTVNGYDGNGTTQYISTNWKPKTNGTNYQLNDASLFGFQTGNVNALQTLWGCSGAGGANSNRFVPRNTDLWVYNVNTASNESGANTDSGGFWQTKRTASNATALFKSGLSVDSAATGVGTDRPDVDLSLLAYNVNGTRQDYSASVIGCFGAGSSMSAQQSLDLYTAFNDYFSSL